MKLMLFTALIATTTIHAEDSPPSSAREKLQAKLRASFPPSQPPRSGAEVEKNERSANLAKPAEDKPPSETTVLRMAPLVVSESKRDRNLEAVIDRQTQKEPFSLTQGGTILRKDIGKARIELGTWGDSSGLSILRISW